MNLRGAKVSQRAGALGARRNVRLEAAAVLASQSVGQVLAQVLRAEKVLV
jgi:hypothetical protein